MDSQTIHFQATSNDCINVTRHLWGSVKSSPWLLIALAILLAGLLTYGLDVYARTLPLYKEYPQAVSGGAHIAFFVISFIVFQNVLQRYAPVNALADLYSPEGAFLMLKDVQIDSQGIHEISQHYQSLYKWAGVMKIEESADYLLFYVDLHAAIFVPKRAFSSSDESRGFLEQARSWWIAAGRDKAAVPAAAAQADKNRPWGIPRVSTPPPNGEL